MANVYRTGTNVDWNNTGNWSTASVPADSDAIYIERGTTDLTTNLDQTGGDVDPASLYIGGTFSGSIGDASTNSLKFDDFSGAIEIDCKGNPNQILNLWPDTVPTVRVLNTNSHPYSCYFRAGTITTLYVFGGQSIRLGASLTISGSLVVKPVPGLPNPQITIVEGCTISGTIVMEGGVVNNYAAIGASSIDITGDAIWNHIGEGAGNITNAVNVRGRAKAYFRGGGWTVGAIYTHDDAFADLTPGNGDRSGPYTVTNATAFGGVILNKRNDTYSNTPVEAGGKIPNAATKTVNVVLGGAPGGFG